MTLGSFPSPSSQALTDEELHRRVASLIVVRASGHAGDRQRRYPRWELNNADLQRLLQSGVGGVILLGGTCVELQQRCLQLRDWAGQPLLLCADVEEGVGQRFEGASWLVPPMALSSLYASDPAQAETLAEHYGACTGRQARQCGLNWVLAPVVDVNNNPDNPVINVRAWGNDPTTVSKLTLAFQRGLSREGVLGCAKHFPGHGDTAVDSHLQLPVLPHDRERLERIELLPFRTSIAAGIDSVMTAHLEIPALDPTRPATLSKPVLSGLLRQELGFEGLIVTDALVMEAIRKHYSPGEAAHLAFEAGADLILMPEDADAAIKAICSGLRSGRITWQQLDASLGRRQKALQRINIAAPEQQRSEQATHQLLAQESPKERALSTELVELTCQTNGGRIQAAAAGKGINLIRVDGVLPCPQLHATAPALLLPERAGFSPLIIHPMAVSIWRDDQPSSPLALERLGDGPVLVQLFLRGNPFRGGRDKQEPWGDALAQLQRAGRLAGVVIYGSPYSWEALRARLEAGIPAAYSPGQMPDAQHSALSRLITQPEAMGTGPGQGFTD